jgi:large subunit ribosomal protein L19
MKAKKYTKETIVNIGVSQREFPEFKVGDTIALYRRIIEAAEGEKEKERIQLFEGDVIARKNNGASSTFTVRKIGAHGVPVELIMPLYSPKIKDIKVLKVGDVRRAKLYYVRDRVGKAARLDELILTKEQKEHKLAQQAAKHAVIAEPAATQTEETE